MPTITISKTYADGDTLFEADLTGAFDDVENFLNVTKINDDNIQSSGITGSTKLVDASVSSAKIASAAITTSKIDDSAVTTAKIADSNVTTVKIADSNVTTAKIADAAITQAKRASLGQQLSSSCGDFSTSSTTAVDVPNLSVSITTTGRPVMIMLISDGDIGYNSHIAVGAPSGYTDSYGVVSIYRDSTSLLNYMMNVTLGTTPTSSFSFSVPASSIHFVDIPAAGTYTYKITLKSSGLATITAIYRSKLLVFEL